MAILFAGRLMMNAYTSGLRALALASLVAWPAGALGSTFVVTTTLDGGPGWLRQALLDANATQGVDTIVFAVPGLGPHVITPLVPMPEITDPLIIDGFSQAGLGVHAIVLDGSVVAGAGLRLLA